jgi:hypothetical protein
MKDIAALDRQRYVALATFRRSGAEVRTPVKRLRHSSRARVAPSDVRGNVGGEWWDAHARIVTEPRVIQGAHAAMRVKYGWQARLGDLFSRLTGRLPRRAWIEVQI